MQSQNWGTVICSECGTRVSIDDAESCYNAELDDVYFVCTKCIEDENRQSPAVSDDSDEAVEHTLAADVCPVCYGEGYVPVSWTIKAECKACGGTEHAAKA